MLFPLKLDAFLGCVCWEKSWATIVLFMKLAKKIYLEKNIRREF